MSHSFCSLDTDICIDNNYIIHCDKSVEKYKFVSIFSAHSLMSYLDKVFFFYLILWQTLPKWNSMRYLSAIQLQIILWQKVLMSPNQSKNKTVSIYVHQTNTISFLNKLSDAFSLI